MTNVITVPPRRRRVHYKGLWGWVEYHPSTKSWTCRLRYQTTLTHDASTRTEAEAVLELKRAIDILTSTAVTVRSVE